MPCLPKLLVSRTWDAGFVQFLTLHHKVHKIRILKLLIIYAVILLTVHCPQQNRFAYDIQTNSCSSLRVRKHMQWNHFKSASCILLVAQLKSQIMSDSHHDEMEKYYLKNWRHPLFLSFVICFWTFMVPFTLTFRLFTMIIRTEFHLVRLLSPRWFQGPDVT